jgi:hypothetical protein
MPLSKDETQLLQQINQGVATEVRKRYRLLDEKLHDNTITSDEHQELSDIINQIELADAERIVALIQLAQLRNTGVDALIDQLAIRRPIEAWEPQSEMTTLEITPANRAPVAEENPWLATAGIFADDPMLEPMLQEILANREAERLEID